MKLEEYLIGEYQGNYFYKIHEFGNDVRVNSSTSDGPYASVKIYCSVETEPQITKLFGPSVQLKKREAKKDRVKLSVDARTKKEYLDLMWDLYSWHQEMVG